MRDYFSQVINATQSGKSWCNPCTVAM